MEISPFESLEQLKINSKKTLETFMQEMFRSLPQSDWDIKILPRSRQFNQINPSPISDEEVIELYNLLIDIKNQELKPNLEEEKNIQLLFIKDKTKGTFALAEYLTKIFNIITIGEHEREMYIYRNGYYIRAENEIIYPEIQRILSHHITRNAKGETFHKIADMTSYPRSIFEDAPLNLIPLKNGVYDLSTKTLLNHSPRYHFTYQFPVIHNAEATCPNIQTFLNQVLQPHQIPIVEEWIGYYFYRRYIFKKALIFVGSGNTGKTTLIETIINLLGKENISGISLQKMASDKFAAASLYDKHGNIVDELSAKDISDTGHFKVATGGGSIPGEYKYGNQFLFHNFAKFTFACNKIPDVKDFDDEAYFDRWIVVRFDKTIENKIPNFVKTLTTEEERSGLFNLAMIGLERLLKQGEFSNGKTAMETKLEMMRSGSSIGIFTAKCLVQEIGYQMTKEEMYETYANYCADNNLAAATMKMFGQRLPFYASYIVDGRLTVSQGKRERGWLNGKIIAAGESPEEMILDNHFDGI